MTRKTILSSIPQRRQTTNPKDVTLIETVQRLLQGFEKHVPKEPCATCGGKKVVHPPAAFVDCVREPEPCPTCKDGTTGKLALKDQETIEAARMHLNWLSKP